LDNLVLVLAAIMLVASIEAARQLGFVLVADLLAQFLVLARQVRQAPSERLQVGRWRCGYGRAATATIDLHDVAAVAARMLVEPDLHAGGA